MSEPKYKIGDKLKDDNGTIHEILSVITTRSGEVKYWVDDNGDRDPWSAGELAVSCWRQISSFFEIGKTYQFNSGSGGKYKVTDIRQFGGEKFAWSEERSFGSTSMTTLDENNFRYMTEV